MPLFAGRVAGVVQPNRPRLQVRSDRFSNKEGMKAMLRLASTGWSHASNTAALRTRNTYRVIWTVSCEGGSCSQQAVKTIMEREDSRWV